MKPFQPRPLFPTRGSLLRAVLKGMHSWMWVMGRQGRVLEVSQSLLDHLQLPREAVVGQLYWELPWWTPSSDQNTLQEVLSRATFDPFSLVLEVQDPAGNLSPVDFHFNPVMEAQAILVEALPPGNSLPLQEQALNHLSQGFALLDSWGRFVHVNPRLAGVLKVPAHALLDTRASLWFPDLTERLLAAVSSETVLAAELKGTPVQLRILNLGSDGGFLLVVDNPTEAEFLRTEQVRLEQQLKLALQGGQAGLWEWDVHSGRLHWDARTRALYGLSETEFAGTLQAWEKLLHPDDSSVPVGFMYRAMHLQQEQQVEFRVLLSDGTVRHLRCHASLVRDAAGQPEKVMGSTWDITHERKVEAGYQEVHAIAQLGRWKWDLLLQELEWSDELRRMWGFELGSLPPTAEQLSRLLEHNSWLNLRDTAREAMQSGEDFSLEVEYIRVNGSHGWMHIRGRVTCNREGHATLLYGIAQDITENKRNRAKLEALSNRLLIATEAGGIGIWEWDSQSMDMVLDRRMTELYGLDPEQAPMQVDIYDLIEHHVHPDDASGLAEAFRNLADHPQRASDTFKAEYRVVHEEVTRTLRSHARILPDQGDGVVRMLGTCWDITDQKATESLIRHQANYDALTDLPNRRLFYELLSQEIKTASRTQKSCALLFIDLDRFKEINDTVGHHAGDQMLIEVANRLRMCIRASDIMARLSGDEFVILLTQLEEGAPSATLVAERILGVLRHPYRVAGEQVTSSASIGIAVFPEDAEDPGKLMIYADQAMSNAKREGKNRYRFFQRSMQDNALEKRRLHQDLGFAIRRNELEMHYQPIVNLSTGEVIKAEALLRWKHPQRGFVSPAVFIPIAEETDLIHQLGDWVFRTVVQQIKTWDAAGLPPVEVSINISPRQFAEPHTIGRLLRHCHMAGVPTSRLIVEITESVFLQEKADTFQQIRQLQDAGIRLALDDFGTGYSSLSYLTRFDTRFIKIDRSFVKNLEASTSSPIIDAIIAMSHQLGKLVVAEGVETREQVQWLQDRNCDFVQGYHFARPMAVPDFEKYIVGMQASRPQG